MGLAVLPGLTGPFARADEAYDVMAPVVKLEAPSWSGSGFAVKRDDNGTYILTNAHVVRGLKKINVKIFYWNEQKTKIVGWYMVEGKVVKVFDNADLGIVWISPWVALPVAEIAVAKDLRILTPAMAVGCGLGEDVQIYRGVITDQEWDCKSGKQDCTDLVQTDCHIVGGCSGGPLFVQHEGRWVVIGVMNSAFSGTRMTFAVPIWKLKG